MCQISRQEFHEDPFQDFPERTGDWYEYNFEDKDFSLKHNGCILNELNHYHITDNYCLDSMHDLAEGIVPLTIQLVLGRYCKRTDLNINTKYINNRINTFPYGYSDRCNKPSPNFTDEMLKYPAKHKMRQSSTQALLLLRAFPFLFGHLVSEDCELMKWSGT